MSAGRCPSCGAPIDFAPGAGAIKVCEHCNTVVAKSNASYESLGKVAALVDTESPLSIGIGGSYQGAGFRVVGRLQKDHGRGVWDEWALAFDDDRAGWLAESEGQWNLLFPLGDTELPRFQSVSPGGPLLIKQRRFVVEERGEANTVSAEGQLPDYAAKYAYVDATGTGGAFVSIEYAANDASGYVGSTVSLGELGFSRSDLNPTPRREALKQARCTQCNGPLELKAPDRTVRVACPYCGALLDVAQGQLSFLRMLEKPAIEPLLKLGAKGKLPAAWGRAPEPKPRTGETEWTVLAFLERSCEVESTRYDWQEYLLFNAQDGFTWLMNANGHWSFLRPIAAGDVFEEPKRATFRNKPHKLFQSVNTRTDFVLGECYWAVEQGETGFASEFIAPPYSLNADRTVDEVSWTYAEIVDRAVIQKAFATPPLQSPRGIAPGQPNPYQSRSGELWKWSGVWLGALIIAWLGFYAIEAHQPLLTQTVGVVEGVASNSPEATRFSEPFTLTKKMPLEVEVRTSGLNNGWEGLEVDLINQETYEVIALDFELSEYHGVEDGESWSETNLSASKSTSAVVPGTYVARTTMSFDAGSHPLPIDMTIGPNGTGVGCPCVVLLLILALPIITTMRANTFETKRWEDSVLQSPDWRSR